MYLGPTTSENVASEIVGTRGKSGHNVEYVVRLADFMRDRAPHGKDEHLFEVESLVRRKLGLAADVIVPWAEYERNNLLERSSNFSSEENMS